VSAGIKYTSQLPLLLTVTMSLSARVAIVTGAASGLGKATALRFAKAGAKVAIVDLPSTQGAALAKELGDNVIFAPADVSNEADVRSRCGRERRPALQSRIPPPPPPAKHGPTFRRFR
jgi:NADPH:quinone reductase-like Zn-dependent oxidoreductase